MLNIMKIKDILNEIGNTSTLPPATNFAITDHTGQVNFDFLGQTYRIDIRIIVKHENKIALAMDFGTDDAKDSMTNKGQALKVMSYIVGCIEEWCNRYRQKFFKTETLNVVYIKYNPKSESDEEEGIGNKRDRLYRAYIEKFAKRYNSNVTFSTTGGIVAKFEPELEIK